MAETTTDHDTIRTWAEKHGGKPAAVKGTGEDTGKDDAGIVRIMFPDAPQSEHDDLEEIGWQAFFDKFEESRLALLYEPDSMFSKMVSRKNG